MVGPCIWISRLGLRYSLVGMCPVITFPGACVRARLSGGGWMGGCAHACVRACVYWADESAENIRTSGIGFRGGGGGGSGLVSKWMK